MMRPVLLLVALAACYPAPVEVEPVCITYLVTAAGDTVAVEDLQVLPENLYGVREWWTEGGC